MSESTKRRTRRSRDEWRRLIDEQKNGGQTQAAFCATRGISVGSLQSWKRRLAASEATPDRWLDLGTLTERDSSGWDIELDLGDGICLRLHRC